MHKEDGRYLTEAVSLDEMVEIIAEEDLGIVPVAEKDQREIDVPLRNRRLELRLTLRVLARLSGVGLSTIGNMENLRALPSSDTADKIAKALDCEPNELFLEWQECFIRGRELPERKNEISIDKVDEVDEVKEEVTPLSESLPDLEGYIGQMDLKDSIITVLATLKERERRVLILHMGLGEEEELTLSEIGEVFGLSQERIRQIECKGLRKLRHPARTRYLKDYCAKNNVGMGQETEALQNGLVNAIYAGDEERVDKIAEKLRKMREGV